MYEFSGKVIKGEGRGRQLGFPTANLDNTSLPINYGVYLVRVKILRKIYQGLLHFGPKKTFNNLISTEVYISGFFSDIYGIIIKVKVLKKIRPNKKFKSVEDLMTQLNKDKLNLL